MDTPHGKIVEETEYSMLYDEEFILLPDSRLINPYPANMENTVISYQR